MTSGLNARLSSAACFIRQDAVFADIGTDHAYLPLFLLSSGRVKHAFCTDINEGPLQSARANAERMGLCEKITFRLTDGAVGLANEGITDYSICGMGGELIGSILSASEHLRSGQLRLVLQPMTRQEYLREYLYKNGFSIDAESYSFDAGKYYVCFAVSFTDCARELSLCESYFGVKNAEYLNNSARIGYIKTKIKALERAMQGKKTAGQDVSDELTLIGYAKEIIKGIDE